MTDATATMTEDSNARWVERLQTYHKRNYSLTLWAIALALAVFVAWGSWYRLDQVARASGEVIASSRVQVIQSVDGGVLAELNVREGDIVERGQVLATLDQTRFGASVKEIEARLAAQRAKAVRLRAEVTSASQLAFPGDLLAFPEIIEVERALFEQRRDGLRNELDNLAAAVALAKEHQRK